ncbi:MAG: hypothetical protein HKN47_00830 [Pirellulaceae bacterium]|nr:hypothetical protein [Pirellulaceae bacterium]
MSRRSHHCHRFGNRPTNRREMLRWCANGFGGIALAALSQQQAAASQSSPLAPKQPHFPAKAKNVIFL